MSLANSNPTRDVKFATLARGLLLLLAQRSACFKRDQGSAKVGPWGASAGDNGRGLTSMCNSFFSFPSTFDVLTINASAHRQTSLRRALRPSHSEIYITRSCPRPRVRTKRNLPLESCRELHIKSGSRRTGESTSSQQLENSWGPSSSSFSVGGEAEAVQTPPTLSVA